MIFKYINAYCGFLAPRIWDGSGTFTRTKDWTDDRDASVKILASRHDENDNELTDGVAACLTKNNESKPTASFLANASLTLDLGSSSVKWRDAYLRGVVGTTTNDNAQTGSVGEVISASASGVSLSTGVTANITSVALTAGDWDCFAAVAIVPAATTNTTLIFQSVSSTSATLDTAIGKIAQIPFGSGGLVMGGNAYYMASLAIRISLATPTTHYLVARSDFSVSTTTAQGKIWCRRAR